jgi:hypothetical protein
LIFILAQFSIPAIAPFAAAAIARGDDVQDKLLRAQDFRKALDSSQRSAQDGARRVAMKDIDWKFWLGLYLVIFGSGQLLAVVFWAIGRAYYPDFPSLSWLMLFWLGISAFLALFSSLPGGNGYTESE